MRRQYVADAFFLCCTAPFCCSLIWIELATGQRLYFWLHMTHILDARTMNLLDDIQNFLAQKGAVDEAHGIDLVDILKHFFGIMPSQIDKALIAGETVGALAFRRGRCFATRCCA